MKDVIYEAVKQSLEKIGVTKEVAFVVEHPADTTHGDYATNCALVVAKELQQSPREVAEQIKDILEGTIGSVEKIEIAGPGFLNFYLQREYFSQQLVEARTKADAWGKNESQSGEVVLFEYTSPNLFKPLHIGNLVGNIIGESFSRLFEFSGAEVVRCNYPSDIGLTVAKGVWGLKTTGGNPDDITALGVAYRAGNEAYENDPEAKTVIEKINKALYEKSDSELVALREQGIATSRKSLDVICKRLGTTFDVVITESEASVPGKEIVTQSTGTVFTESNGAVVYEGERSGLHTRVFLNSQGLPTYEAKDVGHFTLKQSARPDWTQSIIVTGNEQVEYFKVVYAAIKELYAEASEKSLEHIPTGFLTLTTGKMSSRKGNVLTGESLLDEVAEAALVRAKDSRADNREQLADELAVGAIKYQILRHGVGQNIVFDKEKALSFEGDSGPYLQYTHARIVSLLEKASDVGVFPNTEVIPHTVYEVERHLYQFPEMVESALKERAPQHIATYLTQLASAFNTFYAQEKIADPDSPEAPYKAAVADATRITLQNGLWLLGIKAPEKM